MGVCLMQVYCDAMESNRSDDFGFQSVLNPLLETIQDFCKPVFRQVTFTYNFLIHLLKVFLDLCSLTFDK